MNKKANQTKSGLDWLKEILSFVFGINGDQPAYRQAGTQICDDLL